ncbi:hypothetical protein T07_11868 [Trichinella nelsoni]|uniref:Uncharacterized protein n=1 Tax=Trichinella nelsoni TaxID=6336 RepID=A0A0V0SGC5_9BILA|nr:hypothetical protein T07_11868 [Trichinella nelsoni]
MVTEITEFAWCVWTALERRRLRQRDALSGQRAQGAVRAEIQQTHCPEVHYRGNLVTAVWDRARPCCARDSPGCLENNGRWWEQP